MNIDTYLVSTESAASLARRLGIAPSLISQWRTGVRPIPAERCPEIEKATLGAVTCEELRPDVDWAYLRGTGASRSEPEAPGTAVIPVVTPGRRAEDRRRNERRDGERRDSERRESKGRASR